MLRMCLAPNGDLSLKTKWLPGSDEIANSIELVSGIYEGEYPLDSFHIGKLIEKLERIEMGGEPM